MGEAGTDHYLSTVLFPKKFNHDRHQWIPVHIPMHPPHLHSACCTQCLTLNLALVKLGFGGVSPGFCGAGIEKRGKKRLRGRRGGVPVYHRKYCQMGLSQLDCLIQRHRVMALDLLHCYLW